MRSMKLPSSLKPGIWGAVIGAVLLSVLGFSVFGWTLGGTADRMAREQAEAAVIEVLTPICVEQIPCAGGCVNKIDGVQEGLDLGPAAAYHPERRLGNSARNRCS